jgi:hypothetical protein
MKIKFYGIVSFLLITVFLFSAKSFAQTRLNVKINFVEQETRELEKYKNSGIFKRIKYAQLAPINPNQKPDKVEEITFNKMGLPEEKLKFNYYKKVDEKTVYKYNKTGILIATYVYNGNNVLLNKEEIKLNKEGKPIEKNAETLIRGVMHKTKRTLNYDKKGQLIETKAFENGKNFVVKEICEYKDGILIDKKLVDAEGRPRGYENYEFDSQNRKIKESNSNITYRPEKDSTTQKMHSVAYEDKAEYLFKYDAKGMLVEIKAHDYRQVFTYNDKGDFTRDVVYDNGGKTQNDNEFIYDDNGFLKQIIRYYADGKPGAYLDFEIIKNQ